MPRPASPHLTAVHHIRIATSRSALKNLRMKILCLGLAAVLVARVTFGVAARAEEEPSTDHAVGFYDARLQRVVLVSGAGDPKDGDRDKVWSWSGTRWEPAAEQGPPGRVNAGAAYEPGRGKAVIAGGSRKAGASWQVVEDSWEGDRAGWQRISDIPARDHHALVEDGGGGVLMYGGIPADRSGPGRLTRGGCRTRNGPASPATARPGEGGRPWRMTPSAARLFSSAA